MELPDNTLFIGAAISLVLGILQCFCGYRIFKFLLALIGFSLGAAAAGSIVYELFQHETASWIASIVGGIIGSILMGTIYFIGVFVVGGFLGGIFGYIAFELLDKEPMIAIIALLAILFGAAALIYQKIMIIFATGFGGAWYIIAGAAYMLERSLDENIYVTAGCWFVLGVIGTAIQLKAYRRTL